MSEIVGWSETLDWLLALVWADNMCGSVNVTWGLDWFWLETLFCSDALICVVNSPCSDTVGCSETLTTSIGSLVWSDLGWSAVTSLFGLDSSPSSQFHAQCPSVWFAPLTLDLPRAPVRVLWGLGDLGAWGSLGRFPAIPKLYSQILLSLNSLKSYTKNILVSSKKYPFFNPNYNAQSEWQKIEIVFRALTVINENSLLRWEKYPKSLNVVTFSYEHL